MLENGAGGSNQNRCRAASAGDRAPACETEIVLRPQRGSFISVLAVIPAAGLSTRMGRSKLDLPFAETTVLGATAAALRGGGAEVICVVVRSDDAKLAAWAVAHDCQLAFNPQPDRGMLSSVLVGLEQLGGAEVLANSNRSLLVTPGDLPRLRSATVRATHEALTQDDCSLAVPVYRGRSGHPLAIAADLILKIPELDPAIGLRQLKRLAADRLVTIACDDPGCVDDVDTPADYRGALE